MRLLAANAAGLILTTALSLLLLGYTEEPALVPARAFRVAFNLYGDIWGVGFAIAAMLFTTLLFARAKTSSIIFGLITAVGIVNVGLFLVGEWNVWRMIMVVVSVTFASAIAALLNVWMKYKRTMNLPACEGEEPVVLKKRTTSSKPAAPATDSLNFK